MISVFSGVFVCLFVCFFIFSLISQNLKCFLVQSTCLCWPKVWGWGEERRKNKEERRRRRGGGEGGGGNWGEGSFYLWKRRLFYIQGCSTFRHISSNLLAPILKPELLFDVIIWDTMPEHSQFKIIRISACWSNTSYERIKSKCYSFDDYPEHLT